MSGAFLENLCIQASPYFALAVMGVSLFLLLRRYFSRDPAPKEDKAYDLKTVLLFPLLCFLASRLLIAGGVAIRAAATGQWDALTGDLYGHLIRWDAPHYLGLAENGYVTEGDARFHIVFYPLYPLLVAVLRPLFFGNTALCACVLSNACLWGAGCALMAAVWMRQGRRTAMRSVILMMLFPYSIFCSTAYTESLFLLTSCLSVLFARKRRYFPAILFGALSALCRMPGVLTAVPVFYEMLRRRERVLPSILKCVGVLLGTAAYVLLNYLVTGDPLRFLVYQREHWGQQLGLILDTFRYTVANAFSYSSREWQIYTWIPQAIAMLLCFLLLLACAPRRVYPGDGAFMWVYMIVALGTTWLLSGPRYLCGMYALYPAMAGLFRKRWNFLLLCAVFAVLLLYISCAYTLNGWVL